MNIKNNNNISNIIILLSTYNGEKFLDEQLSSLKNQTTPFQLLARDDGSSDKTLKILHDWKKQIHIEIISGRNVGVIESFNSLLELVPPNARYIFFCDQDDIWEPNKIQISIELLQKQENNIGMKVPILLHSDLSVIDDKSNFIHKSFWKFQSIHWKLGQNLNRLMMQNTVTGCSAVINASLLNLVKQVPQEAKMHDWWFALVACSLGKIISVKEPLIRYRIHRNNVVGGRGITLKRIFQTILGFKDYIKNWKSENQTRISQAKVFYQMYKSSLPIHQKIIIEKYLQTSKQKYIERKIFQIRYQFLQQGWFRIIISFLLF